MSFPEVKPESFRRRLTVLHLLPTFGVGGTLGGVETLLLGLGRYADRRKYRLIAALLCHGDRSFDHLLVSAGFDVAYVGGRPRGRADPLAAYRLRRLVEAVGADIVHAHTVSAGFYYQLACLLHRKGVFLYHQHRAPTELQRRLSFFKRLLPSPHAVIAVSRSTAELVRSQLGFTHGDIRVVHNGIEFSGLRAPPAAREKATIVAVGRLSPEKGFDCLVDAMVRVRAAVPDASLHLAGDGPARASLQERVRGRGLGDAVVFHGFLLEPRTLVSRAAVFALPSREEGLPLSLLEAMALGTAIVASDVGGVSEVVSDGVNGLLVAPGDDAALAESLIALLRDPVLRRQLGQAAVETARRFSVAHTAAAIEEVYETLARQYLGWVFDAGLSCWRKTAIPWPV